MLLQIDNHSQIPLSEQIKEGIRLQIFGGELLPHEPLPTVKELAASLNINYNTVAGAYRDLVKEGLLTQNRRAGTRVAARPPRDPEFLLASAVSAQVNEQLTRLGLDTNAFIKLLVAQRQSAQTSPKLRIAAVAETLEDANYLAEKAKAMLGEQFSVVPETLLSYARLDYPLTLVSPDVLQARTTERAPYSYHHEFSDHRRYAVPAGAD